MFEKKAPFLSCGHLSPSGGKKKTSAALQEAVLLGFPPAGGKHKGGLFNENIFIYIHYDMPCLTNGITGCFFKLFRSKSANE